MADIYGSGIVSSIDSNCTSIRIQRDAENPSFGCIFEPSTRLDTVHVYDAIRSVFHTAAWYIEGQHKGTRIFNVVDGDSLTFVEQTEMLCEMFDIPCRILSPTMRSVCRMTLRVGWIGDLIIKRCQDAWIHTLNQSGISYTPIQYVLDRETLATTWGIALDNSLLERETGFRCMHPRPTPELVREILAYWVELKAWPRDRLM
ncbi:hypothetical protein BJ684DRAFT_20790 [Piptocephalis cylindrospora]|uniref:NAD-dependent epimerase/dehydratase domain-containing protein n=1 Tax=Piptocephalis cylindrospora TaxID=1907219 RepID=A0A4P9Y1Y5_9FUNG|nr:hypothetical protein BJ684DRAFT_20790 [Piptocephalis cylindrospora]|eukprot:RKP12684.1 hypothetical protein BJ684DRAFT_20790 [Piptocephalis cylindrospora]